MLLSKLRTAEKLAEKYQQLKDQKAFLEKPENQNGRVQVFIPDPLSMDGKGSTIYLPSMAISSVVEFLAGQITEIEASLLQYGIVVDE